MNNQSKPTTTLTNTTRIATEETWDTNTSTWNTETRTWNEMSSKISNTTRQSSSITNINKP